MAQMPQNWATRLNPSFPRVPRQLTREYTDGLPFGGSLTRPLAREAVISLPGGDMKTFTSMCLGVSFRGTAEKLSRLWTREADKHPEGSVEREMFLQQAEHFLKTSRKTGL
jgi:hypothetical protein